jgi:hypothetical protein
MDETHLPGRVLEVRLSYRSVIVGSVYLRNSHFTRHRKLTKDMPAMVNFVNMTICQPKSSFSRRWESDTEIPTSLPVSGHHRVPCMKRSVNYDSGSTWTYFYDSD